MNFCRSFAYVIVSFKALERNLVDYIRLFYTQNAAFHVISIYLLNSFIVIPYIYSYVCIIYTVTFVIKKKQIQVYASIGSEKVNFQTDTS